MAIIRPIKGFRPSFHNAVRVASRPYDVLNSEEARKEAEGNPLSFLKVIKSEIDLPTDISSYDKKVYAQAKKNFQDFVKKGYLSRDKKNCLYFYRIKMGKITQTGIVCGSSIEDYFNDVIKKHEYTRPVKEKDRITHVETSGIHSGPVFLAYKQNKKLDTIINHTTKYGFPEANFIAEDGIQHTLWVVEDQKIIDQVVDIFEREIDATYIADGHHRAASTSKVGKAMAKQNKKHNGTEPYNFFLSVLFPDNQVNIIDYNRLVKDLKGKSTAQFLKALDKDFEVSKVGKKAFKPKNAGSFGMYLDQVWYSLELKSKLSKKASVVDKLDISILQKYLFDPILGIKDQRTDDRIDFVGGIRGLQELEKRVNSGEMKLAFSIYPVSIQQLFDVADSGEVMPPKSTWFEPKLRSGLVVHKYK